MGGPGQASWSERPSRATGGRGKGRQPTLDELAERVGIDRDRAEELLRANARMRSLSEPTAVDEAPLGGRELGTLGDLLEDPVSAGVYDDVLDHVEGERLGVTVDRVRRLEQRALAIPLSRSAFPLTERVHDASWRRRVEG